MLIAIGCALWASFGLWITLQAFSHDKALDIPLLSYAIGILFGPILLVVSMLEVSWEIFTLKRKKNGQN